MVFDKESVSRNAKIIETAIGYLSMAHKDLLRLELETDIDNPYLSLEDSEVLSRVQEALRDTLDVLRQVRRSDFNLTQKEKRWKKFMNSLNHTEKATVYTFFPRAYDMLKFARNYSWDKKLTLENVLNS
jgi:hypothetical protein